MKKTILIILAALAVAFAFVSCEKEQEEPQEKLEQTRYKVEGYTAFGGISYNIVIYEYDKTGKKLARRTIEFLLEGESRNFISEPGADNIAIYYTNENQTEFYKQIEEYIPDIISIGIVFGNKITKEEYISYTSNN